MPIAEYLRITQQIESVQNSEEAEEIDEEISYEEGEEEDDDEDMEESLGDQPRHRNPHQIQKYN
jgi:hypothetical protein